MWIRYNAYEVQKALRCTVYLIKLIYMYTLNAHHNLSVKWVYSNTVIKPNMKYMVVVKIQNVTTQGLSSTHIYLLSINITLNCMFLSKY